MDDEYYEDEQEYDEGGYEYEYEEQIFVPEGKAFERVGRTALTTYSLKGAKNPFEKFKILLSVVIEKTAYALKLTPTDKDNIVEFTTRAPNIIFKNAACFILGYIASTGGQQITDKSFKKAVDGLGTVVGTFDGIEEPDVLRYAVYWMNNYNIR